MPKRDFSGLSRYGEPAEERIDPPPLPSINSLGLGIILPDPRSLQRRLKAASIFTPRRSSPLARYCDTPGSSGDLIDIPGSGDLFSSSPILPPLHESSAKRARLTSNADNGLPAPMPSSPPNLDASTGTWSDGLHSIEEFDVGRPSDGEIDVPATHDLEGVTTRILQIEDDFPDTVSEASTYVPTSPSAYVSSFPSFLPASPPAALTPAERGAQDQECRECQSCQGCHRHGCKCAALPVDMDWELHPE
jgi:hypothetical protein